jgi:hypothetical protein
MAYYSEPSQEELLRQYHAANLPRLGITFAQAMDIHAIATALRCGAHAAHKATLINARHQHWIKD